MLLTLFHKKGYTVHERETRGPPSTESRSEHNRVTSCLSVLGGGVRGAWA